MPERDCVGRAPVVEGTDWSVRHGPLGTVCGNCYKYIMGESLDRIDFATWVCSNGCHWTPCASPDGCSAIWDEDLFAIDTDALTAFVNFEIDHVTWCDPMDRFSGCDRNPCTREV